MLHLSYAIFFDDSRDQHEAYSALLSICLLYVRFRATDEVDMSSYLSARRQEKLV